MIMERKIKSAEIVFNYLYLRDNAVEKSDLIIGFGHFDMNIPIQCGELYGSGFGDKILFTGGIGGGSADLKRPEAVEFKSEVLSKYDFILEKNIIVEANSTNTGENILFSEKVLKGINDQFSFTNGIQSIIAVASPYRQRRVCLTLRKLFPDIKIYNSPSETNFNKEIELFASKNQDFIELVQGEMERIIVYPNKGFIDYEVIPEKIMDAYKDCKA
jgi:uncharacterized SAM-binding protein YcdF (DUF218 family)